MMDDEFSAVILSRWDHADNALQWREVHMMCHGAQLALIAADLHDLASDYGMLSRIASGYGLEAELEELEAA